jgi:rod shape determining protein RodA
MLLKRSLPKIRWKSWVKPWQQVDWLLFLLAVGLSIFGGLMILSTELKQPVTDWWWHWLVAGIGTFISVFIARFRYENLLQWHWITYALTNLSLIAVMIIGTTAKGAQRWISVGDNHYISRLITQNYGSYSTQLFSGFGIYGCTLVISIYST